MDFEKSKFLKIIVLNSDHLHTKFNIKGGGQMYRSTVTGTYQLPVSSVSLVLLKYKQFTASLFNVTPRHIILYSPNQIYLLFSKQLIYVLNTKYFNLSYRPYLSHVLNVLNFDPRMPTFLIDVIGKIREGRDFKYLCRVRSILVYDFWTPYQFFT